MVSYTFLLLIQSNQRIRGRVLTLKVLNGLEEVDRIEFLQYNGLNTLQERIGWPKFSQHELLSGTKAPTKAAVLFLQRVLDPWTYVVDAVHQVELDSITNSKAEDHVSKGA